MIKDGRVEEAQQLGRKVRNRRLGEGQPTRLGLPRRVAAVHPDDRRRLPAELARRPGLLDPGHLTAYRTGRQEHRVQQRAAGPHHLQCHGLRRLPVPRLAGRPDRPPQRDRHRLDPVCRLLLHHAPGPERELPAHHRRSTVPGCSSSSAPSPPCCSSPAKASPSTPGPPEARIINASGQVGAIIGGLLITATLAAGSRLDQRHPMVGRPPHPGLRPADLRRPERRPPHGPHGLTGPNPEPPSARRQLPGHQRAGRRAEGINLWAPSTFRQVNH